MLFCWLNYIIYELSKVEVVAVEINQKKPSPHQIITAPSPTLVLLY